MVNDDSGSGMAEWQAGWKTVLVASLGISLSTAHIYALGLFMAPLQQAFGWTRAEITAGPFVLAIVGGLGIMCSGMLVDRFGARRVVLPGLLLYALTMATLMLSAGSIWQWYASWLVISLAMPLVTPAIWTAPLVARFTISRGLALAVALAGTGLSSAVSPLIIERMIEAHGWRAGFAFFPLFSALIIFPLALLIFDRSPRPALSPLLSRQVTLPAPALLATMRSPPFLWLLTASLAFAFGLMALMAHLVPILTEHGLDRPTAAAAVGIVGLCSIAGRLTTGLLVDRTNSTVVAGIAFLLPLLPVGGLLCYNGSLVMVFSTSIILGLSLGAEVDIIAYLTAHHFGLRRYGTLLGLIQGSTGLAVGGGPLVGGLIHDATGSYALLLWGCIPVFMTGAIAIIMLGRLPARNTDFAAVPEYRPVTPEPVTNR